MNILNKQKQFLKDLEILLSDKAQLYLDELALRSKEITVQRFGKIINLYAPVYLSNECENECLYCGFNKNIEQGRKTLTFEEAKKEFSFLKNTGLTSVLILTGESSDKVGIEYLVQVIRIAREYFPNVSLEIYPTTEENYRKLVEAGATGLTIYQETYHELTYKEVHPRGKKSNYKWRLEAPERALKAGFRKIGLGVLLGLYDWRKDIISLAEHIKFLEKKYWRAEFLISFPRLRYYPDAFNVPNPVSDREFVQIIFALRLCFPDLGFVLSTREPAELRDNLIGYGITQMSAGSKTNPGGYMNNCMSGEQFSTSDKRNIKTVIQSIFNKNFDPVLKDWDDKFEGVKIASNN